MKNTVKIILLLSITTWCVYSFFLYQKECWEQRNRVFTGTVLYVNNSIGRHSSTCLLDVNWDGIGEQGINGGGFGCERYKPGDRISVPREWSFFFGKTGTAYMPEDPKLLSDSSLVIITGHFIMWTIIVCLSIVGLISVVSWVGTTKKEN